MSTPNRPNPKLAREIIRTTHRDDLDVFETRSWGRHLKCLLGKEEVVELTQEKIDYLLKRIKDFKMPKKAVKET